MSHRLAPWALLVPCMGLLACGEAPEPGWQALWQDQWQEVSRGERWERGVPASGRSISAARGLELRATLLNTGEQPAEVTLTGPGVDERWLVAGEAVDLRVTLGSSRSYTFAAPAGVMLCEPRLGLPLPGPRTVVLVLVDALRDDHVNGELMPGTLAAFPDWRRWTDASTQAPWTLPSLTSLLTARPVLEVTTPEGDVIGVPEGLETWAQVMAEAGFSGAAVVGNYTIHPQNGFARGFSTYLVPSKTRKPPDGYELVDQALSWLAAHEGEDRFLFLHLMDPHGPYRDHDGTGAEDILPLAYYDSVTPAFTQMLRARYAGEVRHLDGVLTRLLGELPQQAVVALTADHGESFGEHGCWAHASCLYQEQVAVPLLIRGSGVPAGQETTPAQLVDLVPTLLDLTGLEPAPSMLGRSLLQGGSQPIVSVTYTVGPMRWSWRHGRHKVVLHMASQPGLGVTARTRMFEQDRQQPGAFVFDLEDDPHEQSPLPLSGELVAEAGNAFVRSAGRTVDGLQLLAWGARGRQQLRLGLSSPTEVIQAWGTAPVRLEQRDGELLLSCDDAFPVCAVAGGVAEDAEITPMPGTIPWLGIEAGQSTGVSELAPPQLEVPAAAVWWNPPHDLVTRGYEQTIERLRALGYLK